MKREEFIKILKTNKYSELKKLKTNELKDLLTERDNNGDGVAQFIAQNEDCHTLSNLYNVILNHAAELLPNVLTATSKYGWHMGHEIARYQKTEALRDFLNFVQQHAPQVLPAMLTTTDKYGWHMGHEIARYQKTEALRDFLNFVQQHAPQVLTAMLAATCSDGWHMGHEIARYQTTGALEDYLALVMQYVPQALLGLLRAQTPLGDDVIDILLVNQKNRGRLICQLVTCVQAIGDSLVNKLAAKKEEVLEYISALPVAERLSVLNNALNERTSLGAYFAIKRGFFGNGTRLKLESMRDAVKEELKVMEEVIRRTNTHFVLTELTPIYRSPSTKTPQPLEQPPSPTKYAHQHGFLFTPEPNQSTMNTTQFNDLTAQAPSVQGEGSLCHVSHKPS